MAAANSILITKHPMYEGPATISKKTEMEAKLELERIEHELELRQLQQVGNNEFNVLNVISMLSLFQAL